MDFTRDRCLLAWFLNQCRFVPSAMRDKRRRHVSHGSDRGGRHLGLEWRFIFSVLEGLIGRELETCETTTFHIRTTLMPIAAAIFSVILKTTDYEKKNKQSTMVSSSQVRCKSNLTRICVQTKIGKLPGLLYFVFKKEDGTLVYSSGCGYKGADFAWEDLAPVVSQYPRIANNLGCSCDCCIFTHFRSGSLSRRCICGKVNYYHNGTTIERRQGR